MVKSDISPVLCRAARGLLGWSQEELARRTDVVPATIRGYELGQKVPRRASLSSIRRAFEQAGVTFARDPVQGVGAFLADAADSPDVPQDSHPGGTSEGVTQHAGTQTHGHRP
jgi:transcriptional regulator with XRE-family HTH domain